MIVDNAITRLVDANLIAENEERDAEHVSSGKLSASRLADPDRYWILKKLNMPRKALDGYTLRKFARGRAVEDWYVAELDKAGVLVEGQKLVEYKGVVGYVDAVVDHEKLDMKTGITPHEVKSITNAHYKRMMKTGDVNHHYQLQAGLYGLAMGSRFFTVDVIASDDLRETVYVFETATIKQEIEDIIEQYNKVISQWEELGVLPEFEPKVPWQKNKMYQAYDEELLTCSADELRRFIKNMKGKNEVGN